MKENEIAVQVGEDLSPTEIEQITERQKSGQNRVAEINEALLPAYQKAGTLVLTEEESRGLMEPFPDSIVTKRAHDGLLYIPHIAISDRLCQVFGPGQWTTIRRREWLEGNRIYAEWVLIVRSCFIGESVGAMDYHPNNAKMNYSDALEGTRGECLRRIAAKELGCGSQVWYPDYAAKWAKSKNGSRQVSMPAYEKLTYINDFVNTKIKDAILGEGKPQEVNPTKTANEAEFTTLLAKMMDLASPICDNLVKKTEKMILEASAFPNEKGEIIQAKDFNHLANSINWARATHGKIKKMHQAWLKGEIRQ